jgi:tRNA nucleotidyltransferase/poly(A) polymerase
VQNKITIIILFINKKMHLKEIITENKSKEKRINFNLNLPNDIILINDIFNDNKFELYLVGGSIRDIILGKTPKDYDLATNAKPDEIIKLLNNQPFVQNIIETGKAFGVINVITKSDEYEIATFRSDVGTGRRPDSVIFTNIEQDVKRRDLTINALFYDIKNKQIVDLIGGVDDIKKGIVKTVGEPRLRFNEDKLRKLRALRFAGRFNSKLEPNVKKSLLDDNSLDGISNERIRDEFIKGIKSAKDVTYFLNLIKEFDMFKWIFPTLTINNFINENDYIILIATILKNNEIKHITTILNTQKYTNDEINKISFLILLSKFKPSQIYEVKKMQSKFNVTDNEIKSFAIWNKLDINLIDKFINFKLSVKASDLLNTGVKQGAELGNLLKNTETQNFLNTLNEYLDRDSTNNSRWFHGGNEKITNFKPHKPINRNGNVEGFYFTTYINVAKGHGKEITEVKLNISNPFILGVSYVNQKMIDTYKRLLHQENQHLPINGDWIVSKANQFKDKSQMPYTGMDSKLQQMVYIDGGYDSVIDGHEIAIFSNKNITIV